VSTPPEATPNAARRREWLPRAAFEATLILIGLLGAFALDEWQDARSRAARVEALLTAIRAELEANLAQHATASAYNVEVAERIFSEGARGAEFVPQSAYPRGLFIGPSLTSAAWVTAQNDTAFSDVPVEKVLMLARVYEQQRIYVDDFNTLLNNMYARLLERDDGVFRLDAIGQPLRIGGVLRDYSRRGAQLVELYRRTLEQLGAESASVAD
jgi:type II secretory pathway pseudopilin PulG